MTLPLTSVDPAFRIYLALTQYPILQRRIRSMMRKELFERGILSSDNFEDYVRQQAIDSQAREGLKDPYAEEPHEEWTVRLDAVRSQLTDLHFANNLPYDLFEELVRKALAVQGAESDDLLRSFNPELAPQGALFEQAKAIARLSPKERVKYEAREREIKVVLIRSTISDQLAYLNIAKDWFSLDDLIAIRRHKIGKGRIGGKAAGMLLALRILQGVAEEDIVQNVTIPESYYLGADVMYAFMANNGLMHWGDQKYKDDEEIRADYPRILADYMAGEFPEDVLDELRLLLVKVSDYPIIVRSSSLLEDNFGSAFAGKYESYFCANQGSPEENLHELTEAIAKVYASGLNPDALLYRRANGLQDYDERLAVLIQVVQGERLGDYYLPHLAGVAFSRNLFRWSPQIRQEDGFLRLVWGLGTRAVDRVGNDYPRLVALSHPELRAQADSRSVRTYSQHQVDLIDIKANKFRSLPVNEVLDTQHPQVRLLASVYKGDDISPLRSKLIPEGGDLVLTLDGVLRKTPFADRMRRALAHLEEHYKSPVDMEFTIQFRQEGGKAEIKMFILQCRPQSYLQDQQVRLPDKLDEKQIVFSTRKVAPHGQVEGIRYVLFVPHEGYYALPSVEARGQLTRAVGKLNKALEGERFICVGPGRWGTVNPDLGVSVRYADIYNTRALVEISGEGVGPEPEPSYGTHFFQDLIESKIYPLAVHLDDADAAFNRDFFYATPNRLKNWLPDSKQLKDSLRVIAVDDYLRGATMRLIMDSNEGKALAFVHNEESAG
ncbi:MAG: hypothetical protein DWG76_00105 [Chloroflexi bacterium]|nr:hypothetical protein [Chloroflexota bacterium]